MTTRSVEDPATPFLYPDYLYSPDQISGSMVLFFPSIIAPMPTGPLAPWAFDIGRLLVERSPIWAPHMQGIRGTWLASVKSWGATEPLLRPLNQYISLMYYSFGCGTRDMQHTRELLTALNLDTHSLLETIDVNVACGELMRHLLAERWEEVGHDTEALYAVLPAVVGSPELVSDALVDAYYTRVLVAARYSVFSSQPILLSRPTLARFFDAFIGTPDWTDTNRQRRAWVRKARDRDLPVPPAQAMSLAFGVFQEILNPYIGELSSRAVELVLECREDRYEEVQALRRACLKLVAAVDELPDAERVSEAATELVEEHLAETILAAVVELSENTRRKFLESLLTDKAVWATSLGAMWGVLHSTQSLTIGGVIGAIGSASALSANALLERRRTLAESDYRIVYHLAHG